ncbi:hypothetical protein FACS189476_04000 [Spirochaetia bacterium]|nr:hypothetical protein FACS189476_04000 [Spirochaetia bacterium]
MPFVSNNPKHYVMEKTLKKLHIIFLLILSAVCIPIVPAQEALKSTEEEYYDFLALQGLTERPYLNYRTLSDSVWNIAPDTEHPWKNQNLGLKRSLTDKIFLKIYGPELFNSVNTAAPYGQNDGALWQGKGYNASLTGGARLEMYGVELTFKPQLSFSQNAAFDIMKPEKSGPDYAGKGDTYGYFWGNVDAPQRFGDAPFFTYDWGDSEIRYTWKTLTVGFGTQAVWLGPSYLNSILHSNNAPTYPKFDIGLRKQRIVIPKVNWYWGDVEARLWVGYLSESDFFDNDGSNNHNMFHGFSFAYSPPGVLSGLTLFLNRVCLVPWEWENLKYIISLGNTIEDQKASFGVSWDFPQVGLEVFGELGIDDFVGGGFPLGYIRYPFHTMAYTVGLKKTVTIKAERAIYGMILFEWNSLEMSQDFQYMWPYSFYFHHQNTQGYTNRGQWLGEGSGWGGNSQYLEFKLYYPKGTSSLFIHRNNPDNNYFYSKTIEEKASETGHGANYFWSWKANLVIGLSTEYFVTSSLILGGGFAYNFIMNPSYYSYKTDVGKDEYMHNFSLQLKIKYQF